jgi:hypothetical protein
MRRSARIGSTLLTLSATGLLAAGVLAAPATVAAPATTTGRSFDPGATVLLARQTATSGCTRGPNPDRRCSPGAYSAGLTKDVICSPDFRTSTIRNVPASEKRAVKVAYGMQPRSYGSALEIDHIISLELGGSNSIANLFPERAPGYRAKDKLENRLHDMVCSGEITLRAAQQRIAQDWQTLYAHVFGGPPAVRR